MTQIAIVEDNLDLQQSTEEYLIASGYQVWSAASAKDFYRLLQQSPVDVVILDMGLPDENGIDVINYLQDFAHIKVIIVSAHDDVNERINALQAGADRYLIKPVDLSELVANIEACIHSMQNKTLNLTVQKKNTAGDALTKQSSSLPAWTLDAASWLLIDPDNQTISLTSNEFLLLSVFAHAAGNLIKKTTIINEVYGPDALNANERVDLLLTRLRKKCRLSSEHALPLKTIRQAGYIFLAPLHII